MTPQSEPLFTELSARRLGPVRRFFVRHPVVMDVVVMLWFGVPSLAMLMFLAVEPASVIHADAVDDVPHALRVGVSFVGVAVGMTALYFRRRRPVEVLTVITVTAVIVAALTGASQGFDLALALALYAVAASRPPGVTWLAFSASTLIVCAALWLWDQSIAVSVSGAGAAPLSDNQLRGTVTIFVMIGALLAVAIGTSVRNRRLHIADLVARTNALARDRDQQAQLARAAERSRIAREMHDVVAHSLSVMIALADGARASLAKKPDRSRVALDELTGTGRSALADMRRVLGVLEDPATGFEPQPDAKGLAELVDRFRTAGMHITTRGLSTPLPDDTGLQLAVFRIVQEALTNTLRHAPASARVHVEITATRKGIEATITDEGRGAGTAGAATSGTGRGVIGMRERVGVYGGVVEAGPWGTGWRVHAALPWAGHEHLRSRSQRADDGAWPGSGAQGGAWDDGGPLGESRPLDEGGPADVTDWTPPSEWDPRRRGR